MLDDCTTIGEEKEEDREDKLELEVVVVVEKEGRVHNLRRVATLVFIPRHWRSCRLFTDIMEKINIPTGKVCG